MSSYERALLLTVLVEVPAVALVYADIRARMAVVALVTTAATHYAMHQPLRSFFAGIDHAILWAEAAVVLVEAMAYYAASRHEAYEARRATTAFGASLLANALSYGAGLYLLR